MQISVNELVLQATQFLATCPQVMAVATGDELALMLAIGSRETNLNPAYANGAVGDNGHGHGVWQLDDRSHAIPPNFDDDITQQAEVAHAMIDSLIVRSGGDIVSALNMYNSGSALTANTTGQNYGPDVYARYLTLKPIMSTLYPHPKETIMTYVATDPATNGYWVVDSTGAVYAYAGAPYLGGSNVAGLTDPTQPCVGIAPVLVGGEWGYRTVHDFGPGVPAPRWREYVWDRAGTAIRSLASTRR